MSRVLVVNDYLSAGGAEQIATDLASGLANEGVDTSVFTSADVCDHERNPISYIHNRRALDALGKRIASFRPDIVHFHSVYHELSPAVLPLPAVYGVPAVLTAHDHHLVFPNPAGRAFPRGRYRIEDRRPTPAKKVITRWDANRARSFIRTAQHLYSYDVRHLRSALSEVHCPATYQLHRFNGLVPAVVVRNGVDFSNAPMKQECSAQSLVFAGRIVPEKGLAQFLAVAPVELLNRLVVLGDGPDALICKRIAADRGASVSFRGWRPRAEVMETLATASALLFPSLWEEVSPLAIIEAFGLGVDVLGSNVGGIPELAAVAEAGCLFDPFDESSIAQTCKDFMNNGPGTVNYEAVRHEHDPKMMVETTLDRYEHVLNMSPQRVKSRK